MNKQEFISKLENIGFIVRNSCVVINSNLIYYDLLNYVVEISVNKNNIITVYVFIIDGNNIATNNNFKIFENCTFEEILISITKLPEIQYILRSKKLNKLLNMKKYVM